jgi:large repetitive protein
MRRNVALLALFLMVTQVFFPFTKALANSNMLPPSNLASQHVTPDDVKLTWSAVYGATGYNVYEITEGQLILRDKVTSTSYNLNNLVEGSYRYVVSTLSGEGESGPSAPVEFDIVYPTMAAPVTLTHTIRNGNDIVLSWSESDYAEQYHLYEIKKDGQKSLLTSTAGRSYTISNAAEGNYEYAVLAENSLYGKSTLSTSVQVEVVHPEMKTPSNFTYSVTNGNDVTLKWDSVPYATKYKLYEVNAEGKTLVSTLTTTTTKFTNVAADTYKYEIHSFSDRYGESAGEDGQLNVVVDEVTMAAPSNFSYKLQNINDVILTWGSVPYATSYKIYQLQDGERTLISTVTGTSVTYAKVPAGDHVYEVYSHSDRFGESAVGSQVLFTVDEVKLAAPSNFTYKIQNGNDIILNWDSTSNTTSYKVYQVINGEKILKSTIAGTTITYSNMPAGDYIFEVHSFSDRFGESAEGSRLSFTLDKIIMDKPANFSYKILNGNDLVFSWETVPYANNYKIYQIVDGKKVLKSTVNSTTISYVNMPPGEYTYEIYAYSTRFGESIEGSKVSISLVHPTMKPPANVVETIKNDTDFSLSWDASEYVNSYRVYQIVDGKKVLKSNTPATSVTYTNMPSGDYTYEVYSYSSRFGESAEGTQVAFTLKGKTMLAPTEPIYSIVNGNDIKLSWKASEYATSYKIYQIVDGVKVLKNTTSGTAITYTNLPEGEYQYVIHSYSSLFGESADSANLTIQLVHPTIKGPSNLAYKVQNGNDVVLNWEAVEYVNSYKIYEMVDGEKILKTTVSSLSTVLYRVPAGDHTYIVHSVSNRFGESSEGSSLSITMEEHIMDAPGNLTHTISNINTVTLKWDPVTYATRYKVYQIVDGERVLKSTLTGTTAIFSNLTEGEHKYEVYSFSDRFGDSPEGSQVSVEIVYPTILAPTNLTYKVQNGNDLVFSWEAAEYANQYKIYEVIEGEKVLKATVPSLSGTLVNVSEGDHTYLIHTVSSRFGESKEGKEIKVPLTHPTMQAPGELQHSIANGNDLTLTWQPSTYATSYKVYQVIDGEKVLRNTVSGTSIRYTNQPEGDYQFEVHSHSTRFGESPEAQKLSFPLVFPIMQAPETVTHTITSGNDLTLKWDSSTYATSYRVYQIIDGEKVLKSTLTGTSVKYINQPEGDYQFEVHSYSTRFGESPEGQKSSFPLVWPIMQAPETVTYTITNGNDLTLKWDSSTYATGYRVYQIIDGEKVLKSTLTGTSVTYINQPEGDYQFEVHSYSSRFGESPEGQKSSFPLVWPIMQAPNNLTHSITNGNDLTLRWSGSTYATAYNVYRNVDGQLELVKTVTGTAISLVNMPEEEYEYVVHSYSNRFFESPEGSKVDFTLTWPVVQAPQVNENVFNINNITLSWPAATWANEYRVYQTTDGHKELIYKGNARSYTAHNLTEDTHTFEVTAYNIRFGESKPSNLITEKIVYPVMESPVATLKLLSDTSASIYWDFITYANGYNIYEIIDGEKVLIGEKVNNLSYTIYNLSYANHEYIVMSYSNSFGESAPSNVVLAKLILDEEAPVTTINAPTDWVNESVNISLAATDNEVGVAKTFYSLNNDLFVEGTDFTIEEEGIHKVSYYSSDKVGNTETVNTAEVKIDKSKPTTSLNTEDLWSNTDVQVDLTAKDNLSGVAQTFYSVNGSEYVEGTSLTISEEGISEVSYYSVDHAGNKEEVQTVQVKVDKTAPTITLDIAEEYALGTDLQLVYSAADNLSGIAHEQMTVNGQVVQNGGKISFDQPGQYVMEVEATDHAGWRTKITKTVLVYIPATVEVLPKVMNGNKGVFTVQVSLPMGYNPKDFDLDEVILDGVSALTSNKGYYQQAKKGQFKFERQDFYWVRGQMTMNFEGKLGDFVVKGQADVKVIK